jgi:tRNA threonylcarbamoyladenosine biosynthesis protein TsaB
MNPFPLLLAIDTCGPSGSVALGRLAGRDLDILGETALAGRTYSATLIAAIADLLKSSRVELPDLDCIIAVNGPGSFTGVRVGLSAAKGLVEGTGISIVAVSRLEVLSRKSGVPTSALDAHRNEIYLRVEQIGANPKELLADSHELASIDPPPLRVAVCDDTAATLLSVAWPRTQLVRTQPPLASDALRLGEARLIAGATVDSAFLDGHYLRRSDAEIFGADLVAQQARAAKQCPCAIRN